MPEPEPYLIIGGFHGGEERRISHKRIEQIIGEPFTDWDALTGEQKGMLWEAMHDCMHRRLPPDSASAHCGVLSFRLKSQKEIDLESEPLTLHGHDWKSQTPETQ
jgi:hypothetical protein